MDNTTGQLTGARTPVQEYDVAIVGAGPVGLYLALALGRRGHQVIILEKQPAPYGRPRAVHFDAEVGRLLGAVGLAEDLKPVSEVGDFYDWQNAERETLISFPFGGLGPSGWPIATMFCQAELEEVLARHVEAAPNLTLRRGQEVSQLSRDDDGVTLTAHGPTLERHQVRARYVVGCDGASSFVRERMGVTMTDLGFFFDWLVVDLVPREERIWSPTCIQVCDPKRPTTAVSAGPGRRRFEFMRMPGETIKELQDEQRVWELLQSWDYTPANAELERAVVYTFHARWADVWYRDRLAIAGDAAHLMPPFAGQGMCSGIRDAANLAWKLDLVLQHAAGDALLTTYSTERSVHVKNAIEESVALGNVICVTDPAAVAERDAFLLAKGPVPENVLPPITPARLGPGVVQVDADGDPVGNAGTEAPQPVVEAADGTRGLWDDVVGPCFSIISPLGAAEALDPGRIAVLERLGVHWVQVVPRGAAIPKGAVADAEDVLLPHLGEAGHIAAAVRPDNYLFGCAAVAADVPAWVDDLVRQISAALP